jgi:hypothetical protein
MSTVDDWIREFKVSVRQIVGVDHIFNDKAPYDHFGKHRKLTMRMFVEGDDTPTNPGDVMPVADDGSIIVYAKQKNDDVKTKIFSVLFPDNSEDAFAWQSDMDTAEENIEDLQENKLDWISKPNNTDFNTLTSAGKFRVFVAAEYNANQPVLGGDNWTIEVDNAKDSKDVCIQTARCQNYGHTKTWRRKTDAIVSGAYTWYPWQLVGGTLTNLVDEYHPLIVIPAKKLIASGVFGATPQVVTINEIPDNGRPYICLIEFAASGTSGNSVYVSSDIQDSIFIGAGAGNNGRTSIVRTNNRQLKFTGIGSSSASQSVNLVAVY